MNPVASVLERSHSFDNYARRMAIMSLRRLLNQITYGPVWSGQPADLEQIADRDRIMYWPVSDLLAPVFKRVLPRTCQQLGWTEKPPENLATFQTILSAIALGFKELYDTQAPARVMQQWPSGIRQEEWLDAIKSRGSEFYPVIGLIEYWEKELQPWAPTLLIHGSCATLDHVPGSSDLDTLLVIGRETLCDPEALAAFSLKCLQSQRYLLEFNPYMHHGHMLVTELELHELSEANLPLCLIEKGITFGARPEFAQSTGTDLETVFALHQFQVFFEKTITEPSHIRTGFDLLWWESSAVFIILLFMQLQDNKVRWKPDALEVARQHLGEEIRELIDFLTRLRLEMSKFLPPLVNTIPDSITAGANPGLILKLQKEATVLTPEQCNSLGINDLRIKQVQAMYQEFAKKAMAIFSGRYPGESPLFDSCAAAFSGKTIIEPPEPIGRALYDTAAEWVVNRLRADDSVQGVYQYGEVGCPGLSDLDILVVTTDAPATPMPFRMKEMPPELQDVMGHDATFISSRSVDVFPKIFPLFGARLLHGRGADTIAASFSDLQSVLPWYTITFMAKYPADLIYLCLNSTVRFKTILAFLHSFKHFLPLCRLMECETPMALMAAIKRDELVRREFGSGVIPPASVLPEIMEVMFRAAASVARLLDEGWKKIAPTLAEQEIPLKLAPLGIEFVENWSEEKLLTYFEEKITKFSSAYAPMPSRLGWFVYWLSCGTGRVSNAIADISGMKFRTRGGLPAENNSALKQIASFRDNLNAFAEYELEAGRHVSKYIALVHIPAQAGSDTGKRIIWLRTDSIGDNVIASAMLPHVFSKFKNPHITVVCQEHIAELYEACPYVAQTVPFNRRRALADKEYRDTLIQQLRAIGADVCLNTVFSREVLTDYLSAGSGARMIIAFNGDFANTTAADRDDWNRFYTTIVTTQGENLPELERYIDYLDALDVMDVQLTPECWTTDADSKYADDFFKKNNLIPEKTIAFFPKAQHDIKLYDRYGEALGKLGNLGFTFIGLGAKDDFDCVEEHLNSLSSSSHNLCGTVSLRQAAELVRRCRLGIGADTGMAHIACAVGTPNVILMGGGHFGRFMPYSRLTTLVCLPLDCFGCNWRCRYSRNHCIKDVHPSVVVAAISSALKGTSGAAHIFIPAETSWEQAPDKPSWEICRISSATVPVKYVVVDPESCRGVTMSRNSVAGTHRKIKIYTNINKPELLGSLEDGFYMLDNLGNERPDWMEYWPIRRYLLQTPLEQDTVYGFFSPEFGSKTGLSHAHLAGFINAAEPGVDIFTFSPQPDMGAFFLNVFEQADLFDNGFMDVAQESLNVIGWDIQIRDIVMDSRHTVFSNYFVAGKGFWLKWLEICEKIFVICEDGRSDLASRLNAESTFPGSPPRKVLLIERVASLLLAAGNWNVKPYDTFKCAWSEYGTSRYKHEAAMSDALKIAHNELHHPGYLAAFAEIRNRVFK